MKNTERRYYKNIMKNKSLDDLKKEREDLNKLLEQEKEESRKYNINRSIGDLNFIINRFKKLSKIKFFRHIDYNYIIYFETENNKIGLGIRYYNNKVRLYRYNFNLKGSCENPILIKEMDKEDLYLLKKELTKIKKEITLN